jgi:signal transduction histidine kinase
MITTPNPDGSGRQASLLGAHQQDLENTLILLRPLVAIAALIAASTPPLVASRHFGAASIVLALYGGFAVALVIAARFRHPRWSVHATAIHVVDLAAAVVATASTSANGPFLILFLFTLLAAALRWGFAEAVLTATTGALLLALAAFVVTPVFGATFVPVAVAGNPVFIRAAYLLTAGLLIGYLVQRERRLRIEASEIAAMAACADVRKGLKLTINLVFERLLRCFGARRVVLIARQQRSGSVYAWEATALVDGTIRGLRVTQLEPHQAAVYAGEPSAAAWHAVRRRGVRGKRLDTVAIDSEGTRLTTRSWNIPEAFLAAFEPFNGMLAVGLDYPGQEWTGRLFLIDPTVGSDRRGLLRLATRLVRHVAPAVQNVYLLRCVRSAAADAERGRIARELHDGIIQGVLGVEIHVAALSRRLAAEAPAVVGELGRLSLTLRQEVIKLRELMQQMHPLDVNGDQLVDVLADFVSRFQRETGIHARFVTRLERVALTPRACREMARIVNEALINVRRHSGARHVYVRLSAVNGDCLLSIEDDGRGFPFAGARSQPELDAARLGPFVIKERVRLLGGQLTVESDPTRGARLQIGVPLSSYVSHG